MKNSLAKELKKLDRTGFRELEVCISISRRFRHAMAEYQLSDEWVMDRLQLDNESFLEWQTGAFPFTVLDISGFEAMCAELEMEKIKSKSMLNLDSEG